MGPSSMLFGRGSTGGVINQVTKKPPLAADRPKSAASSRPTAWCAAPSTSNAPLADTSALRVAAMVQDGRGRRRATQIDVQDFGIAPSLQVRHRHADRDHAVGAAAAQPRPARLRRAAAERPAGAGRPRHRLRLQPTTAPSQDIVGARRAACSTSFDARRHRCATRSQFNHVDTDARETAPQSIGTLGAGRRLRAAVRQRPVADCRSSALFVRLQSHDRVIHDSSLYNQTELTAQVRHRRRSSTPCWPASSSATTATATRPTAATAAATAWRLPPATDHGYAACTPLDPPYVDRPPSAPQIAPATSPTGRPTRRRRTSTTRSTLDPADQAGRRPALRPLRRRRSATRSTLEHAGQHRLAVRPARPWTSPACAAA